MEINTHFEMIINTYNLQGHYRKFITSSLLATFVRDGFFWSLLYLCDSVKSNPEHITTITIILLSLVGLHTPIERFFTKARAELIERVSLANDDFFTKKIIKVDKTQALNMDMIKYINNLTHINENFVEYINNIKIKNEIPFRIITLLIISIRKNMSLLIGLFSIFFMIVTILNEFKMNKEIILTNKFFEYEDKIVKYLTNSKSLIINNEFNMDYVTQKFRGFQNVDKQVMELNNSLDTTVNVILFGYVLVVILSKIKTIEPMDFFSYFLIIYDIEFIADKINEFYKNKVNYNKMRERLLFLYSFPQEMGLDKTSNQIIEKIEINEIRNDKPKINIVKPVIISKNDHILVSGESGSGKTSLLYILKGLVKPDKMSITPSISQITSNAYLTLPNHKNLFDGNSWDIITNFENQPEPELIKWAIEKSKTSIKSTNHWVHIEKLSNGERIRLLLARIIYTTKRKNYQILLFDEIDESLNEKLAFEVCSNLLEIFSDKIVMYITHHEKVKSLFKKKLIFKKGDLAEQF